MKDILAAIQNMNDLRLYYITQGFTIERVLSSKQRTDCDAKAHVVMEVLRFDFKYVPLHGQHYYLFKTPEEVRAFDQYCGIN